MGPRSKSGYRTKFRGGEGKGSSRSRGLWSDNFGTTEELDDEDWKTFDGTLQRLPPTAAAMGGIGARNTSNKDGLSNLQDTSGHATAKPGAGAVGQATSNFGQESSNTGVRGAHPDFESGTGKTAALDVRG